MGFVSSICRLQSKSVANSGRKTFFEYDIWNKYKMLLEGEKLNEKALIGHAKQMRLGWMCAPNTVLRENCYRERIRAIKGSGAASAYYPRENKYNLWIHNNK